MAPSTRLLLESGGTYSIPWHPQSFYFSGSPTIPPNAPIVSQNYTNFRMEKPKSETWDELAKICSPEPEWCCLFPSDCPPAAK